MIWIITIVVIITPLILVSYNSLVTSKAQLKSILNCIHQIEENPNIGSGYDRFIKVWKKSIWIKSYNFFGEGYYDMILKICKTNPANIKAWQLLKQVLKRFTLEQFQRKKALTICLDSMAKEFQNVPIKNEIISIFNSYIISKQDIIDFINHWLLRSVIRGEKPEPDFYLINIPIQIYNPKFYQNKYRVNFDLIYFQINKGDFSMGDTKITYDLQELYTIFKAAVRGEEASIFINLLPRKLTIYGDSHARFAELRYLKTLYEEFISINVEIKKLDAEITKVESLIKTIQESDLYKYQVDTYQRGLNLLMNSKLKATEIKNEYFQFLRERTLSFYLEDVEPNMFKIEDKQINWEIKYQYFKEDYDLLKSMIAEYKKLNSK